MHLRYALGSDPGVRPRNEDSVYASPRLLAVADGMGGHAHGEVASAVVIGALAEIPDVHTAVATALHRLTEMATADPALNGMGSTVTALSWTDTGCTLAHVGDSRGYLLRDDTMRQLTRDHTLVQSLVDDGRISAAEAETHPRRSMLMRALQSGGAATPDLSTVDAQIGDRLLLCSDGVTCVVDLETLHGVLTGVAEPAAAVSVLIEEARRRQSPDNISCVVADVVASGGSHEVLVDGAAAVGRPKRTSRWRLFR